MAEEKIIVPFTLDTADSAKTIKEIAKAIKDLKNQALEAGEGSEGFSKLTAKAGELKDKLNDVNGTVSVLAGNVAENLTSSFGKLGQAGVGGFQAIMGAQALFGNESKDLQKTFVKLQAVMSLSQGIKDFANIGQAAKDFSTVIGNVISRITAKAAATQVEATATNSATIAQRGLNAAMAASPLFIIIAVIAAVAVAYSAFGKKVVESEESVEKFNAALKKSNELYEENNKVIDTNNVLIIEGLKQRGATEKQINDEIRKQNKERLASLQEQEKKAQAESQAAFTRYNDKFFELKDKDNEEQIKQDLEKLTLLENQAKEARKARIDFEQKAVIEDAQLKTKEVLDAKEKAKKEAAEIEEIRKQNRKLQAEGDKAYEKAKKDNDDAVEAQDKKDQEEALKDAQEIIAKDKALREINIKDRKTARRLEIDDDSNSAQRRLQLLTEEHDEEKRLAIANGETTLTIDKEYAEKRDAILQAQTQKIIGYAQQALGTIGGLVDTLSQIQQKNIELQLQSVDIMYNEQLSSLANKTAKELNNENLSADRKAEIQKAAAMQEYAIKLQMYNEEKKIKEKAFEDSKKFQIAQAIIATAQGALQAYTSVAYLGLAAPIVGGALAASVAALGLYQINQIRQQKFDGGSPPTMPTFGSASPGSSDRTEPTRPSDTILYGTGGARNNVGSTQQPTPINVEVKISESEITDTQKTVRQYAGAAEL